MVAQQVEFFTATEGVYNGPRKAWPSGEDVALRGSATAALTHPLALLLLSASLAIAVLLLLVPALRPWSSRATWVAVLGLVAYAIVVVIEFRLRPEPRAPELVRLLRVRDGIADLRARPPGDEVLTRTIADAVRFLDEQLIPAMRQLLNRQHSLEQHLARYRSGELPVPDPAVLAHLRAIHARQAQAIDACLQQAANAYATLVALLQAGGEENVSQRARVWADDLSTLYDTLVEVLHGASDEPTAGPPTANETQADSSIHGAPTPKPPTSGRPTPSSAQPDESAAPSDDPREAEDGRPATTHSRLIHEPVSSPPVAPPSHTRVSEEMVQLVEEALRSLHEPSRLMRCGLIKRLPRTLRALRLRSEQGDNGEPTSREVAQTLRDALLAAVARLKPEEKASGRGSVEMIRYKVMALHYLEGIPQKQVALRLDISDSTYNRYRKDRVRILTEDLIEQEHRYACNNPGANG